ncbi:unnamed protein product, partial [Protopolystoma xenopodis]
MLEIICIILFHWPVNIFLVTVSIPGAYGILLYYSFTCTFFTDLIAGSLPISPKSPASSLSAQAPNLQQHPAPLLSDDSTLLLVDEDKLQSSASRIPTSSAHGNSHETFEERTERIKVK